MERMRKKDEGQQGQGQAEVLLLEGIFHHKAE
jgi:hypothetical protein